ncbi:MAG: hypothetical protein IAF00_10880 [Phycisphaerales bacterium]|nr:hypothetical protein [Phycisphaerales bacterium]
MTGPVWGLLGPATLFSERRTRTLGLGAAVRTFNDLAVPGLGGVWFGKQLFLAILGVVVAEQARNAGRRIQNIETANAIEALACWLALNSNDWKPDPRLRGATKMQGKTDLSFANVRKSNFYIIQPMRMATVQPLLALALAEASSERFNAFHCTSHGLSFVNTACSDFNPCYYSKGILEHLVGWAKDEHNNVKSSNNLQKALSPLVPLSRSAREFLRERLVQNTGDKGQRRRAALAWVDDLHHISQPSITWETKPKTLEDDHWDDLHAGALFFTVRDAAISVLDRLEAHIAHQSAQRFSLDEPIPGPIASEMESLRRQAQVFLDKRHDPSPGELARAFCRECIDSSDANLIVNLVRRDDRVLRLRGRVVLPGAAFRGDQTQHPNAVSAPDEEGAETSDPLTIAWPVGISYRLNNLFLLNLDLHGKLDEWLGRSTTNTGDSQ